MELSAHETDHLRALVQSQNFEGVVEFMAAKVDGRTLPGVGTDTPPNEVTIEDVDRDLEQLGKRKKAAAASEDK